MRRALFAREFRTALVPNLVTVGAILGALVALERLLGQRLGNAEDIRGITDIGLLVCLVVSGFISGERCFPTELKESRMLFLSSLPISRSWAWLAIVSARLLAGVASLALVIAIRRPLRPLLEASKLHWSDIGLGAAVALFAYILFFSAGTLFALLFRRTLFSYVAGFVLLGILLSETLFSSLYSTVQPYLVALEVNPISSDGSPAPPFLAVFLTALIAFSFLLSWRLFVRGEIGNPRRRIKNQVLFAGAVAAYLGFVFCATASTRLALLVGTWGPVDPRSINAHQIVPYGASPDGRYLFVFESLYGRPFMVRVSIVEIGSGRVTGRSVYGGVGWGYWSDHGDVLNLLVLNNSPFDRWGYLVPGTVDWIRLSPSALEISRQRLRGVEEIQTLAGGRALVALREGSLGRILLLDGASGRSSEMARAPLDGQVVVNEDGEAALVYFDNVILPRRAWVIDSLAREVRAPRSSLKTLYVLFGEVFGSSAESQAALLHRFGQPTNPAGAPVRGSFLLPDPNRAQIFTNPLGLYFLEEKVPGPRVVWARSTAPEGRWEKLPDIASNMSRLMEFSFPGRAALPLEDFVDFASGTGAFLSADAKGSRFFVHDSLLSVTLESVGCAPGDRAFLNVDRVPGFNSVLIGLTCAEKASPFQGKTHFFEHLPGTREVRAIKTVPARPARLPLRLYFDERGLDVWVSYDQEIWRSSPGTKDLRLWPPSHS